MWTNLKLHPHTTKMRHFSYNPYIGIEAAKTRVEMGSGNLLTLNEKELSPEAVARQCGKKSLYMAV